MSGELLRRTCFESLNAAITFFFCEFGCAKDIHSNNWRDNREGEKERFMCPTTVLVLLGITVLPLLSACPAAECASLTSINL